MWVVWAEIVELQICNSYSKIYIEKKPYIPIIQKVLDTTTNDD